MQSDQVSTDKASQRLAICSELIHIHPRLPVQAARVPFGGIACRVTRSQLTSHQLELIYTLDYTCVSNTSSLQGITCRVTKFQLTCTGLVNFMEHIYTLEYLCRQQMSLSRDHMLSEQVSTDKAWQRLDIYVGQNIPVQAILTCSSVLKGSGYISSTSSRHFQRSHIQSDQVSTDIIEAIYFICMLNINQSQSQK